MRVYILGVLIPSVLFSQEQHPKPYPGITETMNKLIAIDKKDHKGLSSQIKTRIILYKELKKLQDITLDPIFLRSILLNSKAGFLDIASQKDCKFYSLLESKLLSWPSPLNEGLPIRYGQSGRRPSALTPFKDFFKWKYEQVCKENNDIPIMLTKNHIGKTLAALKFPIPNNQNECMKVLKEGQNHKLFAPLCRISKNINELEKNRNDLRNLSLSDYVKRRQLRANILKGTFLKKMLSPLKIDYMAHLCRYPGLNSLSQQNFCKKFLKTSFWKKIFANRIERTELLVKCRALFDKQKLELKDLSACVDRLTQNKTECHYLESTPYPALVPMPDCEYLSEAFGISRLKADYQDCPGSLHHEGIINISRILSHFDQEKEAKKGPTKKSKKNTLNPKNCAINSISKFVNFNFDNKNEKIWRMRICYPDPIENKEICLPAIIGQSETPNYSEAKIISYILHRIEGAPKNIKCEFVEKGDYNPNLLKYRYKCFLIYDKNYCNALSCKKRIIFNDQDIDKITYKGSPTFDYFPNSLKNDERSITYLLEKVRKVQRRAIKNITDLKYYLGTYPNALIHGQGCIEDIYPRNFNKRYMNQCTPISFIIDGFIEKNFKFYLIVRTGADSIHSPRIVSWFRVYNSLVNYQNLQPINHWTLYGIH
ncbi:MAG: hypothetical protein OXB88_06875 [Bacteriovoracales bacterium]|nr:hypothetical protein [Bacteriovoracales bacterium]